MQQAEIIYRPPSLAASVAAMILSSEALVADLAEGDAVAAASGGRGMWD